MIYFGIFSMELLWSQINILILCWGSILRAFIFYHIIKKNSFFKNKVIKPGGVHDYDRLNMSSYQYVFFLNYHFEFI
jgi:hypothetical protein